MPRLVVAAIVSDSKGESNMKPIVGIFKFGCAPSGFAYCVMTVRVVNGEDGKCVVSWSTPIMGPFATVSDATDFGSKFADRNDTHFIGLLTDGDTYEIVDIEGITEGHPTEHVAG